MSVSHPGKTVSPAVIDCGGTTRVTLSFEAAAELSADPADIVLLMDRSYSMNGEPLIYAKKSADLFIDRIAAACAPAGSETLGGGCRIGLISFSSSADPGIGLTDRISVLHDGIAAMNYGGETNHTAAFEAAEAMLGPKGANRQVIVMFTDGITSRGGDASAVTDRLKAAGAEIFCIGLLDDLSGLNRWASLPTAAHVSSTTDVSRLESLFDRAAGEILLPGAKDVVITETTAPDFEILSVLPPTNGVAEITGPRTLIWKMEQVGFTQAPSRVSLSFDVRHIGEEGGTMNVNESVSYQDKAENQMQFPNPSAEVRCPDDGLFPEPCPHASAVVVPGCQDAVRIALDDTALSSLGRIIQTDVTIKSVCPGKRLAVSVILTEKNADGIELPRGIRHLLIAAQPGEVCRDLRLCCISFSVPEALHPDGNPASICAERLFAVRVLANYIDTDYVPCGNCQTPERL